MVRFKEELGTKMLVKSRNIFDKFVLLQEFIFGVVIPKEDKY